MTRIVALSDTHGIHDKLKYPVPDGDILIHCGDFCIKGVESDIEWFGKFFNALPHKHKIIIAGNHDWFFERNNNETIKQAIDKHLPGVHYLNDNGVTLEGLNFWGSPVTPEFHNWAFNRQRGEAIKKHWDLIPDNTDILITHCPPYNVCDVTLDRPIDYNITKHVGCEELLKATERVKPKLHVFGHIHYSGNKYLTLNNTTYANVCVVDEYWKVDKPCGVFDVDFDKKVTIIHQL